MSELSNWIAQSLEPPVFWNAVSAAGTLLAVVVALFLPSYLSIRRFRNIRILLENELKEGMYWIERSEMLDGIPKLAQPAARREILKNVSLDLWLQHKAEFSVENPNQFVKYKGLFDAAQAIKTTASSTDPVRAQLLDVEVASFKLKYQKMLTKNSIFSRLTSSKPNRRSRKE